MISFEDWQKMDLRIGKIVQAERIENADKLYTLQVDVGEEQPIQIVSGLVPFYSENQLRDRLTVVVTNLEPAVFRGVESQGMLLAAGDNAVLLEPSEDVEPGTRIG